MVIFPALLSGRLCLSSSGLRRETWGKKWESGAADAKSSNPSGKERRVEGQWGCTSLHPLWQSPVQGLILLRKLPPPPCTLAPALGRVQGDPALPSCRGQRGGCQPGRSGCCFPAKAPACGHWPSRVPLRRAGSAPRSAAAAGPRLLPRGKAQARAEPEGSRS